MLAPPTTTTTTAKPKPALRTLTPEKKPPRIVLTAVPGFGKTTFGAQAPGAGIIMARGETGYETLLGVGRVPSIPAETVGSFQALLDLCDAITDTNPIPYRHLVFDALGGFERLCHETVCKDEFCGDWGEKGFTSFQRGYDISVSLWLQFLSRLDRIHAAGCGIILLAHSQIKPFRNPIGPDYDKFVPDCHPKTWGVTHKWFDTCLFGTFKTVVDKVDKKGMKGKAIGGTERVIYTTQSDAYDAKNRYGLPEEISIPDDYAKMWETVNQYF